MRRKHGAGAVVHPQKDARDELHDDRESERAAPHVSPARAAGDVFVKCALHELAEAGAVVEPVEERFQSRER